MSLTLSRLEGLSPARRALLLRKLQERGPERAKPADIPRQPRQETSVFELSSAQERIWFLERFQSGSTLYRLNHALVLEGAIRPQLLRRGLALLAERHEPLRTTFVEVDGRPLQVIATEVRLELPVIDLAGLAAGEREGLARWLVRRELSRPFDLANGPLLRLVLVRTDPERYLAALSLHHAIADHWSLGIFLGELVACYQALASGQPLRLEPLAIQYADYAVWQRGLLDAEKRREQIEYWRRTLGGELPVLELPADHPRPAKTTFRGRRFNFPLSAGLSLALREASRREGVTLFVFLLAGLNALLLRYTGQREVLVGSVVANRERAELQRIFGFLLDTQVFRTELAGEPCLRELVRRTRAAVLGATAHRDLPFEEIVRSLKLDRNPSRQLYQVMLVLLNVPTRPVELPGFRLRPLALEGEAETIEDLNFYVNDGGEAFAGSIEYNAELFEATTIRRLAHHWQNLLAAGISDPLLAVTRLELLSASERQQVREWNATEQPCPALAVHELVALQAARRPDAVALEMGDAAVSYGQLERRVERWARHLRALGVRADQRVGLCAVPSIERIVAVLAILETGAAYVPLDPSYPQERLELMIASSGLGLLITDPQLRSRLPAGEHHVLAWSSQEPSGGDQPALAPPVPVCDEHLVYLTYTSGSTGQPKGVAMVHGAARNLIAWHLESLPAERRTLQFASLSFDVSFQEIFTALGSGGSLLVVDETTRLDVPALAELIVERAVERLFLPVVVAQQLAQELVARTLRPHALREVITAGEQLLITRPLVELFAAHPGARLYNHYGPSETHLATALTLDADPLVWRPWPSVGRPIANTRIRLLDRRQEPVPAGARGELFIGGEGLARGYFNQPALTAARFIPDPHAERPGSRLYRTGDLARWLPGGELEFCGRADHQVKIRGFRVEPGEIEAMLGRHPAVAEAVVVVREDRPGERRLVAYVAAAAGAPSVGELRRLLGRQLPEHMVPAAFVVLPALPLGPNRKVDRKALPAPEKTRPDLDTPYFAPRTSTQTTLAEIWSRVLGIDRTGIDDDFFALGGDSISSLQIVVQARRVGIRFSLKQLYDHPTIAALGALAEVAEPGPGAAPLPGLTAASSGEPKDGAELVESFPLSSIQQGLLFHSLLADADGNYLEHSDVLVPERLDLALFGRAVAHVMRHFPALRTAFSWSGDGEARQVVYREAPPVVREIDLRRLDARQQEACLESYLTRGEGARRLDLARPPLLRLAVFRLAEDRDRFALSYHHLLMDGWSKVLVLDALETTYGELRCGRVPSFEPGAPYRSFVEWQRRQDLRAAAQVWGRELAGFSQPTRLALDPGPRAEGAGLRYRRCQRLLSGRATHDLKTLGQRLGVASATLIQGALGLLLSRYSGRRDVVFGHVVSTRPGELEGIESTVGVLINTLPLRLDASGEAPLGGWLSELEARQSRLEPHRSTPLVEIQRLAELAPGERLFDYFAIYEGYLELGHGRWEVRDWAALDTGYPLYWRARPGERLLIELNHDAVRIEPVVAVRMLEHLATLLAEMAREPERCLGALPMLATAERHQLVAEWNDTAAAPLLGRDFCDLLDAQVASGPDATAAACASSWLSYAELARRSTALAARLERRGVGRGTLVALHAARGLEHLLAVVAVLRAGAAWVPIDPAHPLRRRLRVIAQSACSLVLADAASVAELRGELEGQADAPVLVELTAQLGREADRPSPASSYAPTDLAYVIFTSGSTGVPKGAALTRQGMVNHLWAKVLDLALDHRDAVAQNASQSFDISIWQMLAALLVGARVHVLPDAVAHDPPRLLDLLLTERISVFETVPSLLRYLLDEIDGRSSRPRLAALRWLIPTGEALLPELCRRWLARYPAVPMVNAYGPTECSDDVTHQRLLLAPVGVRTPIGRPVVNLGVYVLGPRLEPLPWGLVGELYVGGVGVGSGYLADPRRSAEVFVPDPFCGRPSARLYATGDLGRWSAEGTLELFGRRDHQVKVRGLRLELGEIEAVLGEHPQVREALVMIRRSVEKGGERDGALVAFAVAEGSEPALEALRRHLVARLPEAAWPARWVWLPALPQTIAGKIDRKALEQLPLPETRAQLPDAESAIEPNPVEEIVAALWARLLGIERVARDAHFFELGGHSLLATQVSSRVKDAFGVELPLRALFEAPTLAAFAARVEQARLTDARITDARPAAPPLVALGASEAPLSFAQQRLWFLDRLIPDSALYNIPIALRVEGRLSVPALEAAVSEIVRRHQVLRTRFRSEAGVPLQIVEQATRQRVVVVDLRGLAPSAREAQLQRALRVEAGRVFDLGRGPMLRLVAVRLAEREMALLVTMHHIASDGWSARIFVPEMAVLYRAALEAKLSPLPELALQYADFARWQRVWLAGDRLDAEIAYWRRQLAGAPKVLELPTDRKRTALPSFRGRRLGLALPAGLAPRVAERSRREGVTRFMLLLAVFQALLARLTGQVDVVVGSPVAGRTRVEIEGLIGFFVNTLALRTRLESDPSFRELLARVRETTLGAYEHQELPFEQLVEKLAPERNLAHTPFFQVVLVLQDVRDRKPVELPGLVFRPLEPEIGTAKFDLSLSIIETHDRLAALVEYSDDLFDTTTARRWLGHFQTLLSAVLEDPSLRLDELPLLERAQRHQLLLAWNDVRSPYPHDRTLPELFERALERGPEAIAVVYGDGHLSYGELHRRACRLACRLGKLGVGTDAPVGICVERGPEMVIGWLAILRAGGAYVPLDPDYPAERLELMIASAGLSVVVTHAAWRHRWAHPSLRPVAVEDESAAPLEVELVEPAPPETLPRVWGTSGQLAYAMYTSGSTGQPKGIGVPQRAVARLVLGSDYVPFSSSERLAQIANASFDASTFEVWGALLNGGCVVGLPREVILDPRRFAAAVRERRVSATFLTTSLFNEVVRQLPAAFAGLRHLLVGGEALDPSRIAEALAGGAPERLLNAYGPTECTTFATWQRLWHGQGGAASVPIGRPIANTRAHVLDAKLGLQPIGVAGWLVLGGDGLARGYLGHSRLTAARFTPDPLGENAGGRLYHTGDLARHLASGAIEFLGRADDQVKLRGFRIELGEIEHALSAYPAIARSAVAMRAAEGGGKQLVAYWSPAVGQTATAAELRAFLGRRLPSYMLPEVFVELDELPLNANGKIDRKALPVLEGRRSAIAVTLVTPESDLERQIAEVWQQVLGLDRVGVTDNFFDLGGHSLLIVQVHERLRSLLQREVPIVDLFQHPTVRSLALALAESAAEPEAPADGLDRAAQRLGLEDRRRQRRELRRMANDRR